MKKRFLAALVMGSFLVGAVGIVQAEMIEGDYSPIVGLDLDPLQEPNPAKPDQLDVGLVSFKFPSQYSYTPIYDEGSELIGYMSDTFAGTYIGTINGNTEPTLINDAILAFLGYSPDFSQVKIDNDEFEEADPTPASFTKNTADFSLTVYYDWNDNDEAKSGSWEVTPSDYVLSFYAIKGGPDFALYFMYPGLSGGKWSTENVTTGSGNPYPEISHFSASASGAPIPEPGTLLLFGTGLAGLAAVGRRRKN